jgi:hypothetical protein
MIEVKIAGIQVSLVSQNRLVLLKELEVERYLPIWIGPFEADAITIQLQSVEVARPLTHDLLKSAIEQLGAEILQVAITDLRNDTFYAEISLRVNGRRLAVDSRPSDAIALAVRARVPVFVADEVMEQAGITPEDDLEGTAPAQSESRAVEPTPPEAFREFLEGLDLSGLE